MKRLRIRAKLTLWSGGVMALIIAIHAGAIYLMTRDYFLALTDAQLAKELEECMEVVARSRSDTDMVENLRRLYYVRNGFEYQVSTERGKILFRSRSFHFGIFSGPPIALKARPSFMDVLYYDRGDRPERNRLATRVISRSSGNLLVHAMTSLHNFDEAMAALQALLLVSCPAALAISMGGGYFLARRALAPVDRMTATAADITARKLNQRLEVINPDDELGRLALTLNGMIERLDRSFEEVRRFTADAAHELRTPLALLRTEIEVALRAARTSPPDGRFLEGLLEEIARLTRLVTQLLFLCREDAGLIPWEPRPVQLDDVVSEVADHIRVVTAERGQALNFADLARCCVSGNEDRLRQLIFNLLDNAIKYTPAGGTINITLESHNGLTRMVVADTGIGIPAEHLTQIFDRFYRVDPSRSDLVEGTGLGLAICRSIAESHGGQLRVESALGHGTEVTLLLPSLQYSNGR